MPQRKRNSPTAVVTGTDSGPASGESTPIVVPDGYILDYISGNPVLDGPEEREATQPMVRSLVETYGYKREQIRTRPQFHVKESPSGKERWPVDIVVFNDHKQTYDNVYMLIETKQKSRKDGRTQLDIYLNMVPSVQIGVWYNGDQHLYLRKVPGRRSAWDWEEIPDLPSSGQRIEDVGLYKRKTLTAPLTLIPEFKDIRNYLAANATGITRDAEIAAQIINVLFCKIYDEKHKGPNELVEFRAGIGESPREVQTRILALFDRVKDRRADGYADVFDRSDRIRLDVASLVYVVGTLQKYEITAAGRDVIGEAFETFIGPALRGDEGQFFTPRNLVRLAVDIIDPKPNEYIIDPASGSGGFLTVALEHVWKSIEADGVARGFNEVDIRDSMRAVAVEYFRGLEKDDFLAKITKAYMAIIGDGRAGIFCEDSLIPPHEWARTTQLRIDLKLFDVLLTNPPFGAKIPVTGDHKLKQYELGVKWRRIKGHMAKTNELQSSQPPQILFIERCLQFLAPGGRMAIVLPEGILGNTNDEYVRTYIRSQAHIIAIVDCPLETFLPSTPTKVALLVLKKRRSDDEESPPVFMAIAERCGHDRRGVPLMRSDGTPDDDFPDIASAFRKHREKYRVFD